ncbi:MAG TPA: DUF2799 domain-containing protein [Thiopseudomonas sp.]|nr:DUF2799 domain-containing protein [Thiopseudomonas sp.]
MKPAQCFAIAVSLLVKNIARVIGLAALTVFISGCASMSEQECLTANWLDQGFRDGRNGQPLSRVEDHRQACAKVGVRPDLQLYLQGRERGIMHYCTPENAIEQGRLGRPYRNACPAHLEHRFLLAYEQGKKIYDAEQRIETLNRESKQLEQRLKSEKDKDSRRYVRQELRDVDRQLQQAREDLRYLERRLRY